MHAMGSQLMMCHAPAAMSNAVCFPNKMSCIARETRLDDVPRYSNLSECPKGCSSFLPGQLEYRPHRVLATRRRLTIVRTSSMPAIAWKCAGLLIAMLSMASSTPEGIAGKTQPACLFMMTSSLVSICPHASNVLSRWHALLRQQPHPRHYSWC
jgi:hypothetical protein